MVGTYVPNGVPRPVVNNTMWQPQEASAVAATALASCGCHMVLFTTGRGTPFGTYVPTMKISTNSTLAKNKPGWIDFNAGVIVENEPMEKTCERFIDYIIQVASGEFVNNEKKGYKEIAIFKTGVTL